MKILRIFPRSTNATPVDGDVRFGPPGMFDEADEIHISVTFTWDLPAAERLAYQWEHVAPVKIGGPATGMRGEDFVPGRYLKDGYVITSRGCPNHCWFCDVWRRDGQVRELPVTDGWNVQDDNLLACSDDHIRAVFAMLTRVKGDRHVRVEFTGGLEAARLKRWHVEEFATNLKPLQIFFAYDTPSDYEPLVEAGRLFAEYGYVVSAHRLRAYVLIGYPGDTFEAAEERLNQTITAGFMPHAMVYRDHDGKKAKDWARFQRYWARPAIMAGKTR